MGTEYPRRQRAAARVRPDLIPRSVRKRSRPRHLQDSDHIRGLADPGSYIREKDKKLPHGSVSTEICHHAAPVSFPLIAHLLVFVNLFFLRTFGLMLA